MAELIVLDYSTANVDIYYFDMMLTDQEVEDFLFEQKHYKESEISWMLADKLHINKYGDNY